MDFSFRMSFKMFSQESTVGLDFDLNGGFQTRKPYGPRSRDWIFAGNLQFFVGISLKLWMI